MEQLLQNIMNNTRPENMRNVTFRRTRRHQGTETQEDNEGSNNPLFVRTETHNRDRGFSTPPRQRPPVPDLLQDSPPPPPSPRRQPRQGNRGIRALDNQEVTDDDVDMLINNNIFVVPYPMMDSNPQSILRTEHPSGDDVPGLEGFKCVVCMENKPQIFPQCGHVCCCIGCSKQVFATTQVCPICRDSWVNLKRMYFP